MEWQEFVDSHIEHCKIYEKEAGLSVEEVKELLDLIRNDKADNEQIIKFAKFFIYNVSNEKLEKRSNSFNYYQSYIPETIYDDESVDIIMKVIPTLNGELQKDCINTLGIAIVNGNYVDDSFIESGYGQTFFKKWICMEEVVDALNMDVIMQLARNGCQEAFDRLVNFNDGVELWECFYDYNEALDFFIGCEDAGIDIGHHTYVIDDAIDNGDEDAINEIASLHAFRYLDRDNLCYYEWVKDYLDGEDEVADIVARNINEVIQYKEDIKWLKSEADEKVPQAQFLMGVLNYGVGGILEKNESLALRYFQAAEANGCGLVKEYILKFEEEQKQRLKAAEERKAKAAEEEKQRKKAEAEMVASAKELIQKAENGKLNANELFSLAAVLSYGDASKGIKKNSKKASKFYRMAAEQGNAEAQYQLGIHLIEGIGCHKNWNAGIKWLKKSAEQDYGPAKNYLSIQDTFFNRMLHKFIK